MKEETGERKREKEGKGEKDTHEKRRVKEKILEKGRKRKRKSSEVRGRCMWPEGEKH